MREVLFDADFPPTAFLMAPCDFSSSSIVYPVVVSPPIQADFDDETFYNAQVHS